MAKWKLFNRTPKPLDPGWAHNYTSALKALGGLEASSTTAKERLRWVKLLSKELYVKGRGEAFIPRPQANGFYPKYDQIPYRTLMTAIRHNSSAPTRKQSWIHLASTGMKYSPPVQSLPVPGGHNIRGGKLTTRQHKHLQQQLVQALPVKAGTEPSRLGKSVPGQSRSRASLIKWNEISPEDIKMGQGYSPLKFELAVSKQTSDWYQSILERSYFRNLLQWLGSQPNWSSITKKERKVLKWNTGLTGAQLKRIWLQNKNSSTHIAGTRILKAPKRYSQKILDAYRTGNVPQPIGGGKGIHKVAFHRLAISLKQKNPNWDMNRCYATAMKTLGRNVSVKKGYRKLDSSGKGISANIGRGGCKPVKRKGLLPTGVQTGAARLGLERAKESKRRTRKFGMPLRDSSGKGVRKNINRGGCYSQIDPFTYGLKEGWRKAKWHAKEIWNLAMPGDILDIGLQGAYVGGLKQLHKELPLPPMEIGGISLGKKGVLPEYDGKSNMELRSLKSSLTAMLNKAGDPKMRKAIENRLVRVLEEQISRRQKS